MRPRVEGRLGILVADADSGRRGAVAHALEREGYAIDIAEDDREALRRYRSGRHALVLIDSAIPDGRGVELCRALRAESTVPLIVLSESTEETDVVAAFDAGADDCITRPFRIHEVVARVRAALRRAPHELESAQTVLEVGDVKLDPAAFEVVVRGQVVAFPLKEFEVLALLIANAGRTLTRSVLIDRIWGTEPAQESKTLDSHIRRIRAKIEEDPSAPTRIVTIRGLGYRYNKPK